MPLVATARCVWCLLIWNRYVRRRGCTAESVAPAYVLVLDSGSLQQIR
jgi:hypothetical protein